MKKKRILIFSLSYFPLVGGAEVAIREITNRLSASDFEFELITLRYDSTLTVKEKMGNVLVHRVGFSKKNPTLKELTQFPMYLTKVFYPPLAALKAMSLHRARKFDLIWSMMSYAGFPAVFFKWFNPRISHLLTLQDGDPIDFITKRLRIRIVSPIYRQVFIGADFVQVISDYLGDFARSMGYKGRMEVIPNGVDFAKFGSPISAQKMSELKNKINIDEGEKLVLNASRLVLKNGVADTILSLKFLPEEVKLMLMGDGPDKEKLIKLVMKEDLKERVCFFGSYTHDELSEHLKLADVFVRPSLSEGQGIVFLEAMAAGVPIVATEVGGIPDFLIDPSSKLGKVTPTGLFVNVGDPKSVAEKIEELLQDKNLARELAANARQLVKEKYDWIKIVKDMKEKIFDKIVT